MAKYQAHHPAPPNKPRENWVDQVGGLPKPIDAIMRALMAKGWPQSRAVATAVNHVKKTCATGKAFGGKATVSPEARAVACRAVAEWEAKKAKARSMSDDGRETVDMASPGLVPVKVKVTNKKGTTFERTMYVRKGQAKAMEGEKGGAKVSAKGAKVTAEQTAVLNELAKLEPGLRPKGWQKLVKTLVDPRHGGRLGPEKRRLLHDVARKMPEGSPLRLAAAKALKADAAAPAERKKGRRVKSARKPRKIEAAVPSQRLDMAFNPNQPRDRIGRFRATVKALKPGEAAEIGDGISVRREGDQFVVRDGGEVVEKTKIPDFASGGAIARSQRSNHPDSIGGSDGDPVTRREREIAREAGARNVGERLKQEAKERAEADRARKRAARGEPAKRGQRTASPKQVAFVERLIRQGRWRDSNAGQGFDPPTRAQLEAMSSRDISALIDDLKVG